MEKQEFPRVVNLSSAKGRKSSAQTEFSRTTLSPTLASVRDTASSWLFARMKEVFSSVDDSLFEIAEKLHHQDEQDGVFHALRTLRLERNSIIERFVTQVQHGFVEVEERPESLEESDDASGGLSLVQDEELEQRVALKEIVNNASRDFATPIAELVARLDTLLPVKIYDENMPLSPAALCRALRFALKPVDIHVRAQLTILKKFQQRLAQKLDALYLDSNQLLISKGVLPDLKNPLLARRPGGRPGAPGGAAPGQPNAAGMTPEAMAAQMAQMGMTPGMMPPNGMNPGMPGMPMGDASGFGLVAAAPGVAPMHTPDLLQHLGELQITVPMQAQALGQVLNVNSLLQERLVTSQQRASLQDLDVEVIRMVDMLFSFMLEDRNLAEPIKVQLIRLQLPLLRIAVADKEFFSKGGHPARKLFNALADAAIGWQPGDNCEKDPLYCEVCEIVETVLREYTSDDGIFETLLESFSEFTQREQRRAKVMERRIVDEAQGAARIQAGKARVAAVFEALTAERQLPRIVHEWLNRVWNHVLFRTCIKEGTDSDNWRRSVLTARDLVWSVVAPMPESSFKMQQLLPGLMKRLDGGARAIGVSAAELGRLLGGLKALYSERQKLAERVESERERRTRERVVQELLREADSVLKIPDAPAIDSSDAAEEDAEAQNEIPTQTHSEELDQDSDIPRVAELQQVAEEAPLKAQAEETVPALPNDDEFWRQTYHLKYSWFKLAKEEGAMPVRCRLAAIIKDLDQFVFVNRSGAKVATYSRLQLAHSLKESILQPLDQGPLFERALQYVVGEITDSKIPVTVDESVTTEPA